MERKIILTEDGSHTLYLPKMDEHYHSTHGAVQESKHVFINAGYHAIAKNKLNIFEVGFGTGLNAFLTLIENQTDNKLVEYFSIEKYPLNNDEYTVLNYGKVAGKKLQEKYLYMHSCDWDKKTAITTSFNLNKIKGDITNFNFKDLPLFDLIYFDAFAPNKQVEVWNNTIFQQLFNNSNHGAILVTYCAKGEVRRTLQAVGFKVERIAGPPGKREMLRASKE